MVIVIYIAGVISGVMLLGALVGSGFKDKEDNVNGKVGNN